MLVLDTSAWIEMLLGSRAGITFNQRMKEASGIIVPTIVQLELAKWALREDGEQKAQELVGYTSGFIIVPLDTAIASFAALCARDHKLHTTDAIIYASAQMHDAPLLTCDAHFKGLPGVEFFEK
jgi:predicted nucleic acid-binding protein